MASVCTYKLLRIRTISYCHQVCCEFGAVFLFVLLLAEYSNRQVTGKFSCNSREGSASFGGYLNTNEGCFEMKYNE